MTARIRGVILSFAIMPLPATDTIPFSHLRHAPLKLDCGQCHVTAKTGERASYPVAAVCLKCHGDMRALTALAKAETD